MESEFIYIVVAGSLSALNIIVNLVTAWKNGTLRKEVRCLDKAEKLKTLRDNYRKLKQKIIDEDL